MRLADDRLLCLSHAWLSRAGRAAGAEFKAVPPSPSSPTWRRTSPATRPTWNRSPSPAPRSTTTSRRRGDIIARAGRRPDPVERPEPRAMVRAVLQQPQRRAERRAVRGRRADGHRRGPLHRQAQPACLDVARSRADLCREHPQGVRRARPGERRDLRRQRRGLFGARSRPTVEPIRAGAGRDPRGEALAGDQRGRVQLSGPRLRPQGALPLADQRRPAGHAAAGAQGDRRGARATTSRRCSRESTVSPEPAKQVARETGAQIWRRALCRLAQRGGRAGADLSRPAAGHRRDHRQGPAG